MRTREEQIEEMVAKISDLASNGFCVDYETVERWVRDAEQRVRAEIARDIKKACDTVMGIETPMMRGDNLAVTLCSYFEDIEGEPDDNGWHPRAIEGYGQVKGGIEQHFLKAIDAAREVG